MESDLTVPTPSEVRRDTTQIGPAISVTLGTATSYTSSRILINIEKESVSNLPIEVEEDELHVDPCRPPQSIKTRS